MLRDTGNAEEGASVGAGLALHDPIAWRAHIHIDKWLPGSDYTQVAPDDEPFDWDGNLLLYGGISCLFQCLIGNGTATGGQALTYFNNSNARIGVGDSNTAAAATQTGLQAASNKTYKAMDATYPQHTDGTTIASNTITLRSTFASGDANYAWEEWIVDNATRALNRKVQSMGTKVAGATWQVTVTLSLA